MLCGIGSKLKRGYILFIRNCVITFAYLRSVYLIIDIDN